jgi:FAD/FMN-containing dehydrogenase
LSYFSSAYGLSFDTVKSFEVILGNGSIVNASMDNDRADLYKALRGGGSNFGIVTRYELYAYPIGNILIDARAYAPNQTVDFFNALAEYQRQGQLDPRSSVSVQILETGPTLLMLYSGSVQQPRVFAPFYALGPYQPILPPTNGSLLDVLALSGSRFITGDIRVAGETFSHISDADLMNDLYNIFVEETANLPTNVTGVWVPNPISPTVAAIGRQYGGNLLGLSEVSQVCTWKSMYCFFAII